jgi:hypothetical protein
MVRLGQLLCSGRALLANRSVILHPQFESDGLMLL